MFKFIKQYAEKVDHIAVYPMISLLDNIKILIQPHSYVSCYKFNCTGNRGNCCYSHIIQ